MLAPSVSQFWNSCPSTLLLTETTTSAGNRGEDSLMVQYSVAKNADGLIRRNKEQDQPVVAPNTSRSKIVNISVNVNTWKPPHYQEHREIVDIDNRKSIQETDVVSGKTGVRLMKENSNPVTVGNGNAKPAVDAQKESQKTVSPAPGLYAAGRPLEDADSRTIFVSNVHFAATKDSLSRHFNKFGEVLKVIIVTDAATGQPKGSAYVEFMRKEAADNALSLDGTSFMSRILKVVRRSAAHQEAGPIMTWPRIARGSPFGTARFARAPFPRGMPGAFRVRPPIKPGARSLQWKRDAQATPAESGAPVFGNAVPSTAPRSLTYVRTEPKPDGNPGTT
ncbi:Polyadenylate-binding protein 2-A [Morella rubra]|uniref:Polyadenylate-binding protein 2-A n=1 Tax=Morella rubra TaxID=262757 RepID=A0A6A1WHQ9_9ROSI|nr:Polyadenylate-binding protein 2-A [Morella rubra]